MTPATTVKGLCRHLTSQYLCGWRRLPGAVENLGGNNRWESLDGTTKPGLQAALLVEAVPITMLGMGAGLIAAIRATRMPEGIGSVLPVVETTGAALPVRALRAVPAAITRTPEGRGVTLVATGVEDMTSGARVHQSAIVRRLEVGSGQTVPASAPTARDLGPA